MNYVTHIKEGLLNLYFSKLRSSLALLGILVGTASVVAMVLGGELATHEALKQFKSLGTDLLALSINASASEHQKGTGKIENLTLIQADSLSTINPAIVNVAPYTQLFNPIFYEGNLVSGAILGVTDNFSDIVHLQLKAGRFISILDQYAFYCVIGRNIYDQLKKNSYQEPLGKTIQIGKTVFVIVGVLESWPENGFVYANIDDTVLVPLLTSTMLSQYATINNIIIRLTPTASIDAVKSQLTLTINRMVADKQVSFRSAKELIEKMKKQSDILTVFLGLIGSISLIVGGIGVMNIMLVSVIERRREIGIRLAIGARRSDISTLFLIEAIMLSLIGGIAGVVIGIVIAYIIAHLWHWEFIFLWWPPIVGFTVSVTVGVFSGFYPAFLASKLDPIEALRME